MLCIKHATVHRPAYELADATVLIADGRIAAVGPTDQIPVPPGTETLEAEGLLLVPGFIELQINGAFGDDFTFEPETIWRVAAELPRYGVTAFLPTIITSPPAQVAHAQQVLAHGPPAGWQGSLPLGLHCEGPFLNPAKKGAHNPAYLRSPDVNLVREWSPATQVRLVTLAPELPGALEVVQLLVAQNVVVSAGHSMASYAEAAAGFGAGIRYGTHIFNAMPPLGHREPGLAGALLNTMSQTVGLIPDGVHVHPAIAALVWAATGSRRLTLVTDAMAALGKPVGRYMLSDREVIVGEQVARLPDGTLAGSVVGLDEALRRFMDFTGAKLAEALPTITATPADLLGLGQTHGRIQPGARADLVLLSPELEVVKTMVGGKFVYTR